MRAHKLLKISIVILLCSSFLYQGAIAGRYYANKLYYKVWADRNLDAINRSADVSFGGDFYFYIDFLRKNIPPDASVVLPPKGSRMFLNAEELMQYFLFPRHVLSCLQDCATLTNDGTTYVISEDDFPDPQSIDPAKIRIPFSNNLGIYAPATR
jgi:hypothetical protein